MADLVAAVLEIIGDGRRPAEARVTALVEAIDRAWFEAMRADRYHGTEAQLLARAVVAAARGLGESGSAPNVAATLAAAQAYVRAPGDDSYLAYFDCATRSYPYGPGEGHYGLADGCEPGSGCYSGSGTLYFIGDQVGFEVLIDALDVELAPWLRAEDAKI